MLLNRAFLDEFGLDDLGSAGNHSGPDPAHPVDVNPHLLSGSEALVGFELAAVVTQQSEASEHLGTVCPRYSHGCAGLSGPIQFRMRVQHILTPPAAMSCGRRRLS